jgi:hypothetical protein
MRQVTRRDFLMVRPAIACGLLLFSMCAVAFCRPVPEISDTLLFWEGCGELARSFLILELPCLPILPR